MGKFFKGLRWLRIVVSLAVFIAVGVQFLDMYHRLPKPYWIYNPTGTQFMPSLLEMLGGAGVLAGAAFIAFSLASLLFGRTYCSAFCPFGILMDILRRVSLVFGKFFGKTKIGAFFQSTKKLKFVRARNGIRIFFLLVAAVLIGVGLTSLLGFIEPYSLFGKVMGGFVHPTVAYILNDASEILAGYDIYWLAAVDGNPYISIGAFSISLFILVAIWLASAWRGRVYCNSICPVGAWLSFISKLSLFKIQIDTDACIKCGLCERNCKAQCMDSKDGSVDFSRCVLCFDCFKNCKKSAVKFALTPKIAALFGGKRIIDKSKSAVGVRDNSGNSKSFGNSHFADKSNSDSPKNTSRRNFAAALGALVATLSLGSKKCGQGKNCKGFQTDANASEFGLSGARPDKRLGVPAGAKSIENFAEKCTGCQICTSACKSQILKPALGEWGLAGLMQPYMDFTDGYCLYTCHACTKACPTGAIQFLSSKAKRKVKIGTAKFKPSLCVVKTDGTDCAACSEHCPVQAIEMVPFNRGKRRALYIPHVHEDVCIGCGACEYICPVRPHRAIVVQGLAVHEEAKTWNESMRIYKIPNQENSKSQNSETKSESSPFPF